MSAKKDRPKLLKKLSSRFKKLKPLKPIPSDSIAISETAVSSPSTHPRFKGKVLRRNDDDDEKLLAQLNKDFKDIEFDSEQYILSNLPAELSMDYLLEQSQFYKEYCDAVERTFKKMLMDNSHSFIIGMQQIQDVKLDLHLTNVLCRNSRRSLQECDKNLIHRSFHVISKYQRRKRLVDTLRVLYEIQKLKDIEQELHKFLDANDFLHAIHIHQEITSKIFGEYSKVSSLELMRKRFRDGTRLITNKLSFQLLTLLFDAPNIDNQKLNILLQSYHKVNEFHLVNSLLEESCSKILTVKCTHIICKHLGYNESYINRTYGLDKFDFANHTHKARNGKHPSSSVATDKQYKALCRKLKVAQFMECFMDICGRVFDILHAYYKIESFLIKFRAQHSMLSEDMNIVRKQLWIDTQNLLGGMLETSQFSLKTKIKMEDLLLALHGATIFKIIGQSFSGSESTKLSSSIRSKCISYLEHFRKTFFESIKTNFDNEMWVVLPIPANFGVHSIKELQRNTQWRTVIGDDDDNDKDANTESKSNEEDNGELKQMNIYQKFLSGENIFDTLLENKRKDDREKKSKPSNIFDDDSVAVNASNIGAISKPSSSNIGAISKPSDDGTEPCLTSTSLNLAKFIGKCLQIMECLDPVSYDAFCALRDSFKFYLYHVFIWFGVNVHNFFEIQQSEFTSTLDKMGGFGDSSNYNRRSRTESAEEKKKREQQELQRKIMKVAQTKYPILTQVINEVNELLLNRKLAPELEDLIKKKFQNNTLRPRRLPHYAKCYMEASEALELSSAATMQGVAARFVATETLPFLVSVIKSQHGRLINILNKNQSQSASHVQVNYSQEVSTFIQQIENVVLEPESERQPCSGQLQPGGVDFIQQIENVVLEFKKYMYRNVPTLLVHLGSTDNKDSIISRIHNTNWNMKTLTTEPNGYVSDLIAIFDKIEKVLSSFPTLPKFIHNRLNKEAIIYVEEQLVEAYADCKKCTTEGRALMSLDQSVLKKSYPICKYKHSWEYTTNFIQAYYLPQQDLLKWIEQHPEYPLKAHKSFLRVGKATENLKRSQRSEFEAEIEKTYKAAKQKQIKMLQQEQKDRQNKPNLKQITDIALQTQTQTLANNDDNSNPNENDNNNNTVNANGHS
eukprot:CAMPEP_0197080240 /NCGR_PEP_ID=MMETSP1384-20130603/214026_1 /TAXON_ID=29189 /ORGANISM="Ammonia sp." /LENGTH=1132 /DNA_ID=CAMNT_0042519123 /DNA_START=21 /DNA_END=3421 /DNA_ORIENTATION=-